MKGYIQWLVNLWAVLAIVGFVGAVRVIPRSLWTELLWRQPVVTNQSIPSSGESLEDWYPPLATALHIDPDRILTLDLNQGTGSALVEGIRMHGRLGETDVEKVVVVVSMQPRDPVELRFLASDNKSVVVQVYNISWELKPHPRQYTKLTSR